MNAVWVLEGGDTPDADKRPGDGGHQASVVEFDHEHRHNVESDDSSGLENQHEGEENPNTPFSVEEGIDLRDVNIGELSA